MEVKIRYKVSWEDDYLYFNEYEDAVKCAERKVAKNLRPVKLERVQWNELKTWKIPAKELDKQQQVCYNKNIKRERE